MFGLKRQLRKLQKRTAPKPEFKRDLWATLEHEYEDAYGPLPSARPVRLMYRLATVGVAVVVIFVATGTGVYAYNSPGVSDGHVLYPIKQGIEQVECGVLRDPERRATCHARMMQRRLDEAEVVTDSDRKERILEHAADELGVSVNEIKRDWVNPEDRSVLIEELSSENERFIQIMNQLRRPDPEFEGLEDRFEQIRDQLLESDLEPEQKQQIFENQIQPIMQNLNQPRPATQELRRRIINQNN